MKIRYTVKRENGFVFFEIFTVEEIEKGEVLKWLDANHVNPDNVIRDRYTGSKDKNDVEGYVNDRCLFPDGVVRTLIQGDGCFGFKGTVSNIVHCDQHTFKTLEIIGNIHQPEPTI